MNLNVVMRTKLRWILIGFIIIFTYLIFYVFTPLPKSMDILRAYPPCYYITKPNKFELQPPNQCAAYSTAFILRNFGIEGAGEEIYKKMRFKIPLSGYVLPKGIIKCLSTYGLRTEICRGNISSIKSKLSEGNPIIVLIGQGLQWQHYMTFVGYNGQNKELYFYDSRKKEDENDLLPGNRTMTEDYFMELWENGLPIFNRVYISVFK